MNFVLNALSRLWHRHIDSQRLSHFVIIPIWCLLDRVLTKNNSHWAFFAHPLKTDQFVENSRAVYEFVKDDPSIRKVVFARGSVFDSRLLDESRNVRVFNIQTLAGLVALARCGVFLLTNSVALDMSWRWGGGSFSVIRASLEHRVVVNLWHGIPLKRLFGLAKPDLRKRAERIAYRRDERKYYTGLVSSSDVDGYAMAAMFEPIKYSQVWLTGLPRNDFLRMAYSQLPLFLSEEVDLVRRIKGAHRLIVYAPTFREQGPSGTDYYQFSDKEISDLRSMLKKHGAILGFRMHYFRKGDVLFNMEKFIDGESIVDLGHSVVREIAPVIREASIIISDYSSVYIDALYVDKPVFSFAYDLDDYQEHQNGLLYDMELAFPGPVLKDFTKLLEALDTELAMPAQIQSERYRVTKKLFFNFNDDKNSERVVSRLKSNVGSM